MMLSHPGVRSRVIPALAVCLAILAGTSCGAHDSAPLPPPLPAPGVLSVHLTTPNSDDRAIQFTLSGGAIGAITAPDGANVNVYSNAGAISTTVIVVGALAPGVVARIEVPDVARVTAYQAAIGDVARADYSLRPAPLSGYALAIRR